MGFCELRSSHQQQLRKFPSPLKAEPLNFRFSVIHSNFQRLLKRKKIKKMYVVALLLFYLDFIFSYIFFLLIVES